MEMAVRVAAVERKRYVCTTCTLVGTAGGCAGLRGPRRALVLLLRFIRLVVENFVTPGVPGKANDTCP